MFEMCGRLLIQERRRKEKQGSFVIHFLFFFFALVLRLPSAILVSRLF